MGRLTGGAFGPVYGKVGGTVGSNWKGINTLRQYAIPANPDSDDQKAQRAKFKAVSKLAISLIPTLITAFWNMFAVKMSGYNYFIKKAFPGASSTGLALPGMQVTTGTLEGVSNLTAEYTTVTGTLDMLHSGNHNGNGLDTDSINVLVLDNRTNAVVHYETALATRVDAAASVTLPPGLVAADLIVFCWFSRGTGSELMVSNSTGAVPSAA